MSQVKQQLIAAYLILINSTLLLSSGRGVEPVTPQASPEARALLKLMYDISGTYTLMGQHNYPNTKDRNSQFAARYIGEIPAIWSTDKGFAEDGDTDSYLTRPDIVQEAIRQHKLGSLVTICWHAVPPTADEPVTFRPQRGADSTKLEIDQDDVNLISKKYFIVEWGDDRVTEDTLKLDGTEQLSQFWSSPRVTTATWSQNYETLFVESKTTFTRGECKITTIYEKLQ